MGSIAFTNVACSSLEINYLKINDTVIFNSPQDSKTKKPAKINDKSTYVMDYDGAKWGDFNRMWLTITVGKDKYSIDLNKDHYFYGGDYHYPGEGATINYFFSGFSEDGKKIQFNECYLKQGDTSMTYCNDLKYLDLTT